jgi:hypothetical protein
MAICPIIDRFVFHVRAQNRNGWDREMDTVEPSIQDSKRNAPTEARRGIYLLDWSVREVLVDTLLRMNCLTTATTTASIPEVRGSDGVGTLMGILQSLAEAEPEALTEPERAQMSENDWLRLVDVAESAQGVASMLQQALADQAAGASDADLLRSWNRLSRYSVWALSHAQSIVISPGPAVNGLVTAVPL